MKCFSGHKSLQTRAAQRFGFFLYFSGLKEARRMMYLGCPITG